MTRRGWWGDKGPRRHARGGVRCDSEEQATRHELAAEDYERRARSDAMRALHTGIPVPSWWDGHFAGMARAERDLAEKYRASSSRRK